eukprot:764685-Hanusia_phi.AAC.4
MAQPLEIVSVSHLVLQRNVHVRLLLAEGKVGSAMHRDGHDVWVACMDGCCAVPLVDIEIEDEHSVCQLLRP